MKNNLQIIAATIIIMISILASSYTVFSRGFVDVLSISIDYGGLGYSSPPIVIAGLTIPGVATYTPADVKVEGGMVTLTFTGLRQGLERLEAGNPEAGPSLALALIDYTNGRAHMRQAILTPQALSLLRGQDPGAHGWSPLDAYKARGGAIKVRIDSSTLDGIRLAGLYTETIIPRGFSDLADTRPSFRAQGSFDDYIQIPGCVAWDGALAYHDPELGKSVYKVLDPASPFIGYLANHSAPGFWLDHGGGVLSWLGLVSSVYAAEYMVEYTEGDDIDLILSEVLPGVGEYVRSSMGGPNQPEPPPVKRVEWGYLSYGTMEYWLGYEGRSRWINTKDLEGIDSIYGYNVTLLELGFDNEYTGNPNIISYFGHVIVTSFNVSITGYGVMGVYTSAINMYRQPMDEDLYVSPGERGYIYGDVVFGLGSDVGVILYDVLGIGVDECGDTWIIVEPQFIFYVDVIPYILTLAESKIKPVSNVGFMDEYLASYTYYQHVYTPDEYNNRRDLLKRWSIEEFYDFSSAYYFGAPPLMDLVLLMLEYSTGGAAGYITDLIGLFTNIAYEAYNIQGVGIYISASLYDTYIEPDVDAVIEWSISTSRFFRYTQTQDEPLPLISSRMNLTLRNYQGE